MIEKTFGRTSTVFGSPPQNNYTLSLNCRDCNLDFRRQMMSEALDVGGIELQKHFRSDGLAYVTSAQSWNYFQLMTFISKVLHEENLVAIEFD
jgi:hypothetical protein